jgi:hypothetical protein
MSAAYDKTGREIMQGDVLKVFHFVGARNKRHYMYKQVAGERLLGQRRAAYWFVSHLDQSADGYHLAKDGSIYRDSEIVQSVDARFEDRPRHTPAERGAGVAAAKRSGEACAGKETREDPLSEASTVLGLRGDSARTISSDAPAFGAAEDGPCKSTGDAS